MSLCRPHTRPPEKQKHLTKFSSVTWLDGGAPEALSTHFHTEPVIEPLKQNPSHPDVQSHKPCPQPQMLVTPARDQHPLG